jgi:hypothetical protein
MKGLQCCFVGAIYNLLVHNSIIMELARGGRHGLCTLRRVCDTEVEIHDELSQISPDYLTKEQRCGYE